MQGGLKITTKGFMKAVHLSNEELLTLCALTSYLESEVMKHFKGAVLPIRCPDDNHLLFQALFEEDKTLEEEEKAQLRILLNEVSWDFTNFITTGDSVSVNIAQELLDKGYVVFDKNTDDYIVRVPFVNDKIMETEAVMYKFPLASKMISRELMCVASPKKVDKLDHMHVYTYAGLTADNFLSNFEIKKNFGAKVVSPK